VASLEQLLADKTANKAGTAGYQDCLAHLVCSPVQPLRNLIVEDGE
jgi:hypothetical protein